MSENRVRILSVVGFRVEIMIYRQFLEGFRQFIKTFRQTRTKEILFSCILFFPIAALAVAPTGHTQVIVKLPADTTAAEIQRALNSLPAAGGEVVLPPGKIVIDEPIILGRDNQALRGAGDATILFLADSANCPVIIMGEPVNHPDRVRHLRVSDLFIDGNRAHQNRECWRLQGEGSEIRNNGITVQNVSDSMVEDVTTAHCRSGGLVTTLNTRRFTARDLNSFDNEFDGLACFLTEDCVFTNLYLHDNLDGAGISLDGNFNHNIIDDAILAGNDLGIFMRWSHDNQFRDISIRNSRNYGVFMAQVQEDTAQGARFIPRTECTNNSFTGLIASRCGGAVFRVNDATCTNNFIKHVTFTGDIHGQMSLALPGLLMMK